MPTFGVNVSPDLKRAVDRRLKYGDSRSEWIAEAISIKLFLEKHDELEAMRKRMADNGSVPAE